MGRVVAPEEVTSPRKKWSLFKVIHNEGEGEPAVALGNWKGKARLAMRWNGKSDKPLGNPQSRGLPTWFIIPDQFEESIILKLDTDAQKAARFFLDFTRNATPKSGKGKG